MSDKKLNITLEVIGKDEEAARLVLAWRNDPLALEMSFDQRKQAFEVFFPRFCTDYFLLRELPPLFALLDGKRVAYVRFRPFGGEAACEISIVVGKEFRGKGIGTAFLAKCEQFVRERGYSEIFAKIKLENSVSKKTFARAGYHYIKREYEGEVPFDLYRFELIPHQTAGKVFIIGEAGSNWRLGSYPRDLECAKRMIEVAHEAGCDAIKFQTFRPDTTYAKGAGKSSYLEKSGIFQEMDMLFSDLAMPYEMIGELAEASEKIGIEFMSTPFSPTDFREVDHHVKRHKIASYEMCHVRLLELVAASRKPLILSTGASTPAEIHKAIDIFRKAGGKDLTLLHCTAAYPAPETSMNLRAIGWMLHHFGLPCGLSDHSMDPLAAPLGAVALGATVIEKHFTLSKRLPGPDHSFALEPQELKIMCTKIRQTESMLGESVKKVTPAEVELYRFAKRKLQATAHIRKGETFREGENFDILRPGVRKAGVDPWRIEEMHGKKATREIQVGEGICDGDW